MSEPYTVCIVVDPDFGEKLAVLPMSVPVWIVNTPANTPVAHRLWKERPRENHLTGITIFDISSDASPEENLLGEFDMIDLHHGTYSATPPYTQIQVIGTPLSEKIKLELADYGFDEFSHAPAGFLATRKIPTSEPSS